MNGQAILTISAAVTGLTQLIKSVCGVIRQEYIAAVVFGCSLLGVALWGWHSGDFTRASSFDYFSGWIAVTTSAAGVFGLVNAGQQAIAQRNMSSQAVGTAALQATVVQAAQAIQADQAAKGATKL